MSQVRVAMLDDHQSIIDGHSARLERTPGIEVVAAAFYGEELLPMLAQHVVDVLLLDVEVPTASDNANPYPILTCIPELLQKYPDLTILIISMHTKRTFIRRVMEAGASGYILKDDRQAIYKLGEIVHSVAQGGIYLSQQIERQIRPSPDENQLPTPRQLEVLSLLAAYPDMTTAAVAARLHVAHSTVRNLLSNAYLRLGVRTRAAAISKARQLDLITPQATSLEERLHEYDE